MCAPDVFHPCALRSRRSQYHFEIGLGLLLIILDALGPLSKLLAGGWAFIGGIVLIIQAFQMRKAKQAKLVGGDTL